MVVEKGQRDPWHRTGSQEIDPFVPNDFQQGCQSNSIGKGTSFQQMMLEKLGIIWGKRTLIPTSLNCYLISHANNSLKTRQIEESTDVK